MTNFLLGWKSHYFLFSYFYSAIFFRHLGSRGTAELNAPHPKKNQNNTQSQAQKVDAVVEALFLGADATQKWASMNI